MLKSAAFLFLLAFPAAMTAQERPLPPPERDSSLSRNLWRVSVAAYAAGSAADAVSSWGMREANPALRGPDGRLGARGTAIAAGIGGGSIALEAWLIRKYGHRKLWTVLNFAAAGVYAGVAARNSRLR